MNKPAKPNREQVMISRGERVGIGDRSGKHAVVHAAIEMQCCTHETYRMW